MQFSSSVIEFMWTLYCLKIHYEVENVQKLTWQHILEQIIVEWIYKDKRGANPYCIPDVRQVAIWFRKQVQELMEMNK